MSSNPLLKELADPRLVKSLALEVQANVPLNESSSMDEVHAYFDNVEKVNDQNCVMLLSSKPKDAAISATVVNIMGMDGNQIPLHIFTPEKPSTKCLLYIHGGGMGIYSPNSAIYSHFSTDIAAKLNCTVIAVEFRNSSGALGRHPFPAGLHDCKSALEWIHSQKEEKQFSHIFLCGESGGANLSIALTLLMKSENKHSIISGIYAMCPYISGLYAPIETEESAKLPSLRKFDYCGIIDLKTCHFMAVAYDPERQHTRNPLAWPYWATDEDLQDLPPFVIALNELDPLFDEGMCFYRRLMKVGVSVRARTVLGTPHAGDLLCMSVLPELYLSTLYDIKAFVDAVQC